MVVDDELEAAKAHPGLAAALALRVPLPKRPRAKTAYGSLAVGVVLFVVGYLVGIGEVIAIGVIIGVVGIIMALTVVQKERQAAIGLEKVELGRLKNILEEKNYIYHKHGGKTEVASTWRGVVRYTDGYEKVFLIGDDKLRSRLRDGMIGVAASRGEHLIDFRVL